MAYVSLVSIPTCTKSCCSQKFVMAKPLLFDFSFNTSGFLRKLCYVWNPMHAESCHGQQCVMAEPLLFHIIFNVAGILLEIRDVCYRLSPLLLLLLLLIFQMQPIQEACIPLNCCLFCRFLILQFPCNFILCLLLSFFPSLSKDCNVVHHWQPKKVFPMI